MTAPRIVGRYVLHQAIASGGMATVHLGRLASTGGFSRTVAIKKLHPHVARDPEFVAMFLDEARIVARIQHPNVVPTLDVVSTDGELFIVMDHVLGESLSRLIRAANARRERIPVPIAAAIACGLLHGLHAAHEATSEAGEPLGVVHRDVSPQNVLVGVDGVTRVLDFGIAKAVGRSQSTRDGQIKGKISYMPPEQVRNTGVDRRTDVYAASVVLWELLSQQRFLSGDSDIELALRVLEHVPEPPSRHARGVPPELDAIVMRGLSKKQAERFATAREMAIAIEDSVALASPRRVGEWVESLADEVLKRRGQAVIEVESGSRQLSRESLADAPVEPSPPEETTEVSHPATRFGTSVDRSPWAPRRSRLALVLGAAGLLGLSALFWLARSTTAGSGEAAARAPVESSAVPPPPPLPPAPSAPATASEVAPTPAASSASPPPKKPRPAVAPPSCADPYVKDARGVLHVKPGCL